MLLFLILHTSAHSVLVSAPRKVAISVSLLQKHVYKNPLES